MTKYTLLSVLLILCLYAICIQLYANVNVSEHTLNVVLTTTKSCIKVYKARATAYNTRSKINHRGKKLVNGGIAVPSETLKDGTRIYVPVLKKWYIVDDRMYYKSVNKHYKIARRKGKHIDIVIDIRWHLPTKKLRMKDLGYTEIHVYEN